MSIHLDSWSQHHHGYTGLLANYITNGWRRERLCLACRPSEMWHTGENIARWVETECDKWGITENVVHTDTIANMMNHILQFVIKDKLLEKPSIKSLIEIWRHVCTFSNQSVQLSQIFVIKQIETGKKKYIARWNSTLLMLKRFLELKPVSQAILLDQDLQKKLDVNHTNADRNLMEKVVKFWRYSMKLQG